MATKTEICNLALSHLGNGTTITNVDSSSERSSEANVCRIFYGPALDEILRDFEWPFATKIAALGLVEEDPNEEWGFSYRYPADCLYFRRILSGTRNDDEDTKVKFRLIEDETGGLILTDQDEAKAEYTFRQENAARYSPDFVMAFSFLLASYIWPKLGKGDTKKKQELLALYAFHYSKATASANNERVRDREPDAEIIRAREA